MARDDVMGSACASSDRGCKRRLEIGRPYRRLLAVLLALIAFSTFAVEKTAFGATSVHVDQARVNQIKQQLAAQGRVIQGVVSRYDQTQAELSAVRTRLGTAKAHLVVDHRAEQADATQLRRLAVDTYVSGGSVAPTVSVLLTTSNLSSMALRSEFMSAISGKLQSTLDALRTDRRRTQAAAALLAAERAKIRATLAQLGRQRQSVQAAISSDNAMLTKAKGNLQAALSAEAAQQLAAQRAAEQAMVHPSVQALPANATPGPPGLPPPSAPPSSPVVPAPGTYANPLRAISGLSPERIDQGVDYSGYGPIYAIGNGVVLNTVNSGWPGGTFISYRLTNGPAAGDVVYAAEDIYPLVQVGQAVTANTVLGTVYEGPDGIETGWADPSGQGYTMAYDYNQFSGSNSTAFGYNFSQLLQYLGAPGGVLQNNPPTGSLPPGWPSW
ncbi:MAG: coiled-coil domain-containing protein [Acidimicrobiales bacterium]